MRQEFVCAFTGHRPGRFRFGYDEEHPDCIKLKQILTEQINLLIQNGCTTFLTGMALGVDIWGAEILLKLRQENSHLRLIAALPCETQANRWSAEQRERYFDILAECDDVKYISYHYTKDCMLQRNRWLVDHADVVLAVYDGSSRSGTGYTVRYAYEKKKPVIHLDPDRLELIANFVVFTAPQSAGEENKT